MATITGNIGLGAVVDSFDAFVDSNRTFVCFVNQYSEYYRAKYLAFPITLEEVQNNVFLYSSQKSRFLPLPEHINEKSTVDAYAFSPDEGRLFTKFCKDACNNVFQILMGYSKRLPFKAFLYDEVSQVVADTSGKVVFFIEQPNNLFPDTTVLAIQENIRMILEQWCLREWWRLSRVPEEFESSNMEYVRLIEDLQGLLHARLYTPSKFYIPIWADPAVQPTGFSVQFDEYVCQQEEEEGQYTFEFNNSMLTGGILTLPHPLNSTVLMATWYDEDFIMQPIEGKFTILDASTVQLDAGTITGTHTLRLRKYQADTNQYMQEFTQASLDVFNQLLVTHSLGTMVLHVAWYDDNRVLQETSGLFQTLTPNTARLSCGGAINGTHLILLSNE